MKHIGIIGGSGIYNLEGVRILAEHKRETPFGKPSDAIIEIEVEGEKIFFLARHGRSHNLLPHEVNYRANIFALKELGVKYTISFSAVGSLKEEYPPSTFVLPDQFIDWTKGKRERTFFGEGIVAHFSMAHPVEARLRDLLYTSCKDFGLNCQNGGTYICVEGPQFSTQAESKIYHDFGASVIGMTNVPESYLAKEACMAYATVAMVTDFDCWKEHGHSISNVKDIMEVMKQNNKNGQKVLKKVVSYLAKDKFDFKTEKDIAVMTPKNQMSERQVQILDTLLS